MKKSKRKIVLEGMALALVFGVSAGGAYYLTPSKVIQQQVETDGGVHDDTPKAESHIDKLLNSVIVGATTTGISADITEFELGFNGASYVDEDTEEVSYYGNTIKSLEGAGLELALNGLNIHGLNLAVALPFKYNGKKRRFDVDLIKDTAYLSLLNLDAEDKWDLKYKVDLGHYYQKDDSGRYVVDPLTGGISMYEYGKLDWLIDDILNILLSPTSWIDFSFPSIGGLIEGLINGASSGNDDPSVFQGDDDDLTATLLDSLQSMKEDVDNKYFTWDLTFNGSTYQIGLQGDDDYNLKWIDFPAKVDAEYKLVENNRAPFLLDEKNGLTIKTSIEINTFSGSGGNEISWRLPADAASYVELDNSAALFEDLASLVATPKFGIDIDLNITHTENASDGKGASETTLPKPEKKESSESMLLELDGNVDCGGKKNKLSLNGFDAKLRLSTENPNDSKKPYQQSIGLAYLYNEVSKTNDAYLNINNVLRAKTDRITLDAFMGKFNKNIKKDPNDGANIGEGEKVAFDIATLIDQIRDISGKMNIEFLDEILDSAVVNGLVKKQYESLFDLLDEIMAKDNKIYLSISLLPLGIKGSVSVTLCHNEKDSLLEVGVKEVQIGGLGLDGTIKIVDFVTPSVGSDVYDELEHLPGIGEQISAIADSKAATLGLHMDFLSSNVEDKDVLGGKPGLLMEGKVAFDIDEKAGAAELTLTEHTESYYQDHNILLEVGEKTESVNEEEVTSLNAYFHYDSINPTVTESQDGEEGQTRSAYQYCTDPINEDGINGQINFNAAFEKVKTIINDFTADSSEVDDRFARIASSLALTSGSGLLSDLTSGHYFSLLQLHVIKEASLAGDQNLFIIDGSKFGLGKDITITIDYLPNVEETEKFDGGIESLSINLPVGDKELNLQASIIDTDAKTNDLIVFDKTKEDFTSYNPLIDLVDYGIGTAFIGAPDHHGVSTYSLSASLDLQLGNYAMNALKVDGNVYVNGAQVKAYVGIDDIPVIKGINGPENNHYFRDHELMGSRDVGFYFYADGFNPQGTVLMTRDSSYGKLEHVRDSVMISMAKFSENLSQWLLEYLIGVNSKFFEKEEEDVKATTGGTSSSTLGKALHIDDAFKGLESSFENDLYTWGLSLNLGSIIGMNFLDEVKATFTGKRALIGGDRYQNILTGLEASVSLALMGELKVASASFAAEITNVVETDDKGYEYVDGFTGIALNAFDNGSVKTETGNCDVGYFNADRREIGTSNYGWIYDDEVNDVHYNRNYNGDNLQPGNFYVLPE